MTEIKDSLYEHTNNLTTVSGQRVVEWFSGKELDTFRWDTTLVNNGTVAMSDTSNGGLILSTGTSSGTSSAQIDFGDIRQFGNGSCIIWTAIHSHSANGESYSGLTTGSTQGSGSQGIYSYVNTAWKTSNFDLYTVGASGNTWTNGTIAGLTSNHAHKLELTNTTGKSFVDGVLNCESTTNLPTAKMQPAFGLSSSDTTNKTINITYCEAWNT
jgi:hypothetical protein